MLFLHNSYGTSEGESYIVLFYISQFDCFLFARDISVTKDMSGISHSCLGCVSQVYSLSTVKLMLIKGKF